MEEYDGLVEDGVHKKYSRGNNPNSQKNIAKLLRKRSNLVFVRLQGIRQFLSANKKQVEFHHVREWYMNTFHLSQQTFENDIELLIKNKEIEKRKSVTLYYVKGIDPYIVKKYILNELTDNIVKENLIKDTHHEPEKVEPDPPKSGSDDRKDSNEGQDLLEF